MRKLMACLVALLATTAANAAPIVVTFDDLPSAGGGVLPIPNGYGGINWASPQWGYYTFAQPPYNPASPPNRALANRLSFGAPSIPFEFLTPDRMFIGAAFAGNSSAGNVFFELYNDNVLVHTSSSFVPTATPTFLATNYTGAVDRVVVRGTTGFYVLDNVTYDAATTPEPISMIVFGGLLVGGAGVVLRRRMANATA